MVVLAGISTVVVVEDVVEDVVESIDSSISLLFPKEQCDNSKKSTKRKLIFLFFTIE